MIASGKFINISLDFMRTVWWGMGMGMGSVPILPVKRSVSIDTMLTI